MYSWEDSSRKLQSWSNIIKKTKKTVLAWSKMKKMGRKVHMRSYYKLAQLKKESIFKISMDAKWDWKLMMIIISVGSGLTQDFLKENSIVLVKDKFHSCKAKNKYNA